MALVGQRAEEVPVTAACTALGVSRASLYRSRRPRVRGSTERVRPPSPRRLDEAERRRLLDTFHLAEFADQPPTEVYAALLGRGIYLASIRTMYRVLADAGETKARRNQRPPHVYAAPSLTATAPNQVWTWDITKLATPHKGVFLMAYVIIDLFSRYVVGWMVATKECKHLAAQLFAETIARHGIEPGLQVHADRGAAMKSDTLAQLLASLGASRSFSRPRVSDDNAFSEAQFKTLKYQPDYPGRFDSEMHGRAWLQDFFGWHNDDHHHSGLALFTPADVFHGRVEVVRAARQDALDAAYAQHPERFPHGAPRVPLPPTEVHINPVAAGATSIPSAAPERSAKDCASEASPRLQRPRARLLRVRLHWSGCLQAPRTCVHSTPHPTPCSMIGSEDERAGVEAGMGRLRTQPISRSHAHAYGSTRRIAGRRFRCRTRGVGEDDRQAARRRRKAAHGRDRRATRGRRRGGASADAGLARSVAGAGAGRAADVGAGGGKSGA
jgi:putative transposase